MPRRVLPLPVLVLVSLVPACASSPDIESFLRAIPIEYPDQEWHTGPDVFVDENGTARFVGPLYSAFDELRAMRTLTFVDGYYRAPANEGYDAVIDHLEEELRAAGFGGEDDRLGLDIIESPAEALAWTPVSASLRLVDDVGTERVLHAFDSPGGVDRVMLPVFAPSCSVEGEIALTLEEIKKGMILVTDVRASQVLRRAQSRGAVAVVSASLEDFNEDPFDQGRHEDSIQFVTLGIANQMPVAQISGRTLLEIEEAVERGRARKKPARLRFDAEVRREERPLRTLVATIYGDETPGQAVAMVSHVQEPGANDNATGVAGMLEGARSLVTLLEEEEGNWPDSSLVFIWGDEFSQSEIWLEWTDMTPIAGISSDMTGAKRETGAKALLERMPDPGALTPLPPDEHTPWGAGRVDSETLTPSGFAVIARCAMVDVGLLSGDGWVSGDHPWEGGSDHDVFIARQVPAVLFWHFTDFTYHTSLDRIGYVDPAEMRRTSTAILATALATASPSATDLDRYLRSLDLERDLRVQRARDQENEGLEALWQMWSEGARNWLRKLCLDTDEDLPGMGD